jgi:hypothetical protein
VPDYDAIRRTERQFTDEVLRLGVWLLSHPLPPGAPVATTVTFPSYGGQIVWWRCGECGARVRYVYRADAAGWRCWRCAGLGYRSTYQCFSTRAVRRAHCLRARLGAPSTPLYGPPPRPRGHAPPHLRASRRGAEAGRVPLLGTPAARLASTRAVAREGGRDTMNAVSPCVWPYVVTESHATTPNSLASKEPTTTSNSFPRPTSEERAGISFAPATIIACLLNERTGQNFMSRHSATPIRVPLLIK